MTKRVKEKSVYSKLPSSVSRRLLDKRALSNTISAIMLAGVSVAMGFAVLVWAQSTAFDYTDEHGNTIDSDIAKLKERLGVEYIFYNSTSNEIIIYLINSGTIGDVEVQYVRVKNSTWTELFSSSSFELRSSLTGGVISNLDVGGEGYVTISDVGSLKSDVYYQVKITTGRGVQFDSSFAV